ncbi:hypothetical protein EXIGLDRAFT_780907 [Exidia glandulosa HHB12029]|uniref:Uncharacterized protein n=1 Tax=Exidia glandulosa HHB12029 TaxID=1314781 RepID=A0A165BEL0_EXIGL|nr:hypothetical protein EXIGLDRAFT_780907 [Exidia glandulosa HHB12029]
MDPLTLFSRFLVAGGHASLLSRATMGNGGTSGLAPNLDDGTTDPRNEPRPRPAPFNTFSVVHRCRDFRVFVARNAPAPQIADWPSSGPDPSLAPSSDVVYSTPRWFVRDDPAPYASDPFDGMGPPASFGVNYSADLAAVWSDSWVTESATGYVLKPVVTNWIESLDRVLDETLGALGNAPVRLGAPQPSASAEELKAAWRAWALEVRLLRATIGYRLIGNEGWKDFSDSHPALWEQLLAHSFFEGSMVGTWFADPVREKAFILYLIKIGVPVYYEWTADMSRLERMKALEPRGGMGIFEWVGNPSPFRAYKPAEELVACRMGYLPPIDSPEEAARIEEAVARQLRKSLPSTPGQPTNADHMPPRRPPPAETHPGCAHDRRMSPSSTVSSAPKRSLADRLSSPKLAPQAPEEGEEAPEDNVFVAHSSSPAQERVRPRSLLERMQGTAGTTPSSLEASAATFEGSIRSVFMTASGWIGLRWWGAPQARITSLAAEFVFEPRRPDEPRLFAQGPASTLAFLHDLDNKERISDHLQFLQVLLLHNISIVTGIVVEQPDPSRTLASHAVPEEMRCRESMGYAAATAHWRRYATEVLQRPHGLRAARLAGGIFARVALELLPHEKFPVMPTDEVYRFGCPDPATVDGIDLHDDWLSADEQKILLGYDWDSNPDSPRLLLPYPNIWEKYAGGVWMPWHDDWFVKRLSTMRLGGGGAHYLAHNGWSKALRTAEAKFLDAKNALNAATLASRPQLATLVHDVTFPDETVGLSLPLDRTRRGLQRRFSPAQRRLRTAVVAAVDCCTNATNFCIICPTSNAIFDTFQLGVLAPRLESLTLDQRAIGPPKLGYGVRPPSKGWYSQESVTASLLFPKVTVLCLSNMKYRLGTAALSHPTIRASFPALRALFLSWIHLPAPDLRALLAYLGPVLDTLSLHNVVVRGPGYLEWRSDSPLALIDEQVIPDGSLPVVTDLRIIDSPIYSPSPRELRLQSFLTGIPTVTKLTIGRGLLLAMHSVPASLEHLVVYYDISADPWRPTILPRTFPLKAAAGLKQRLPQFIRCAPRLRTVEFRVCDVWLDVLVMWKIISWLLHSFCRNLGVEYITKIQLNHPSVRLEMHEAELAKHGLPLTERDEDRLFGEAWSPQNSWDMTGFAAYSYTI